MLEDKQEKIIKEIGENDVWWICREGFWMLESEVIVYFFSVKL